MLRTWRVALGSLLGPVLGLVLLATAWAVGPAYAAPATTTQFAIYIVGDGPVPAAGTSFSFDAQLLTPDDQAPVAGVPVTLEVRPYGGSAFAPVAHAVTDAAGQATARAVLYRNSAYRWSFAGTSGLAPTTSGSLVQEVGSRVTVRVADSSLTRRQRVVVSGRAAPLEPGHRVTLWRGDRPSMALGTSRTRIAVGVVGADGTFRLTARFAHRGLKKLYVLVSAGDGNAAGYSRYLRVRVHR